MCYLPFLCTSEIVLNFFSVCDILCLLHLSNPCLLSIGSGAILCQRNGRNHSLWSLWHSEWNSRHLWTPWPMDACGCNVFYLIRYILLNIFRIMQCFNALTSFRLLGVEACFSPKNIVWKCKELKGNLNQSFWLYNVFLLLSGVSNSKVTGLSWSDSGKCTPWVQCKLLWIKASTKSIIVDWETEQHSVHLTVWSTDIIV